MNMAAFAVIVARERETGLGDSIQALAGLGRERPLLAWPMTISMLALAGIPATAGFMGKFYLIDAAVSGGYTWLGVVIVIGSMISLGYYLPVIAAMWMREAPAADDRGATRERSPRPSAGPVPLSQAAPPSWTQMRASADDGRPAARGRASSRPRRRGDDLLRRSFPSRCSTSCHGVAGGFGLF